MPLILISGIPPYALTANSVMIDAIIFLMVKGAFSELLKGTLHGGSRYQGWSMDGSISNTVRGFVFMNPLFFILRFGVFDG